MMDRKIEIAEIKSKIFINKNGGIEKLYKYMQEVTNIQIYF